MSYFVIIARDGIDEGALDRRNAVRDAHMEKVNAGIDTGQNIMGAAMLDDNGNMCGSIMTVKFEDRAALDEYLKAEPYVIGNVWQDIEVIECKIPLKFLDV
ncbi:MAG: hypothetical protein KAJ86_00020 [Alphaproteobacteria bacterium]|nr:hypothetical protein [Alphaproteobacteria bacterium]